jgi:Lipoate-protein ligase A
MVLVIEIFGYMHIKYLNANGAVMKKRLMILSNSKDPYINHAIEEILFTTFVDYEQILFLWVNEPSVVFGRNQNPWHEIDVRFAEEAGIHLLRRISGGGTVFHDEGNLNYAFIEHHSIYDENAHFEMISEAIQKFGLEVKVTARKDITLEGKKISGSAFFLKGMRRLHHGTLLVDVDLDRLWKSLKVNDEVYKARFSIGRTIPSVPSPVINLAQVNPKLKVSDITNAIVDEYYKRNEYDVELQSIDDVIKAHEPAYETIRARHASWEWVFGETPSFSFRSEDGMEYQIVNGAVTPTGNINSILTTQVICDRN